MNALLALAEAHAQDRGRVAPWGSPDVTDQTLGQIFLEPTISGSTGESVSAETALTESLGLFFVGPPGSGKTTLLRVLAMRQADAFIRGTQLRCPAFLRAHELHRLGNVDAPLHFQVAAVLRAHYSSPLSDDDVADCFAHGNLTLLIDGLDEVPDEVRQSLVRSIRNARASYQSLQIVISSRPSMLPSSLTGFQVLSLGGFTDELIQNYIKRLGENKKFEAKRFLAALRENKYLQQLATTPLLLGLLWQTFLAAGALPKSPTVLYADFTDYILSDWDARRGIANRSEFTIRQVHRSLERLALAQFNDEKTIDSLAAAIEAIHEEPTVNRETATRMLSHILVSTGILIEATPGFVSFAHLSLLEFYVARALADRPENLLLAMDRPNGHQVAIFACGLVEDVGPIVEAAMQRRHLILAAKCISNGPLTNTNLAAYVAQQFRDEVGDRFIALLNPGQPVLGSTTNISVDLLDLWNGVNEPGLPSHVKGRRLEEFAKCFFGKVFGVIESNLNTEDGEIDVLLENRNTSPFWLEFGSDIFVECKNWTSHTPLHEIAAFSYKATRYGVRLAFFFAVSGFTSDAARTMKNQAVSTNGPLLVPLNGEQILHALENGTDLEEFLKRQIRDVKYLRKY